MSEIQFGIFITIQVVIPIICIFSFKYLESYFSKKGENLATIEDIDQLTSKVESIKYEFAKLLEADKSEKLLLSQRLAVYNSQKDELIFQVFEQANQLFNELRTPNLDLVGDKKGNQLAWESYLKMINNSINSIITLRSKLTIFLSKDEEVLGCIDALLKPLVLATTELNKLSSEVSKRNSVLIAGSVYTEVEGEYKVNDFEKMKDYINQLCEDLIDFIKFVYSLQPEFESAKATFLDEVQNYYEKLRNQFNVR